MDEFELIDSIFAQLTTAGSPSLGLTDDAAILMPPAGQDLVFTKDMMVADRHFFATDPADVIASRLLRVNLSDLAAMGAYPLGYLLAIAYPGELDETFTRKFVEGLARDQQAFNVALYGGDTISGADRLTLSVTAIGSVPHGSALRRNGARAGDAIYVSGTIGDSALGLLCLKDELGWDDHLVARYYTPEPRLNLGMSIQGIATAAIDVSDGLVGDLGHICRQSGVGADVEINQVPLSPEVQSYVDINGRLLENALTGGDDYELLFTVSPEFEAILQEKAKETGVPVTKIGVIRTGSGVQLSDRDGKLHDWGYGGYRHP